MHKWEKVIGNEERFSDSRSLCRTPVDGGYLYRYATFICFVPAAPAEVTGPPSSGVVVMPSLYRQAPYKPAPDCEYVDVEYTEVPAGEVNGSKVDTLVEGV